jgi:hypothetical protein
VGVEHALVIFVEGSVIVAVVILAPLQVVQMVFLRADVLVVMQVPFPVSHSQLPKLLLVSLWIS